MWETNSSDPRHFRPSKSVLKCPNTYNLFVVYSCCPSSECPDDWSVLRHFGTGSEVSRARFRDQSVPGLKYLGCRVSSVCLCVGLCLWCVVLCIVIIMSSRCPVRWSATTSSPRTSPATSPWRSSACWWWNGRCTRGTVCRPAQGRGRHQRYDLVGRVWSTELSWNYITLNLKWNLSKHFSHFTDVVNLTVKNKLWTNDILF